MKLAKKRKYDEIVELLEAAQSGGLQSGERPLGEKLPDGFEIKDSDGETWNLTGAIELHRLVLQDNDQLKKRKDEITKTIIDSTCAFDDEYEGHYKEVSLPPLPLLCSSRHCSLLVGWVLIKKCSCS